jgi:hypothetical protein
LIEHTAKLVSGLLQFRDLGSFEIKGMRDAVRVHELEGVGRMRTRLDVSRTASVNALGAAMGGFAPSSVYRLRRGSYV